MTLFYKYVYAKFLEFIFVKDIQNVPLILKLYFYMSAYMYIPYDLSLVVKNFFLFISWQLCCVVIMQNIWPADDNKV